MAIKLVRTKPPVSDKYYYALVNTSWGHLAVVCQGTRLCRVIMPMDKKSAVVNRIAFEFPLAKHDAALLTGLQKSIVDYFRGSKVEFNCQVDISWAGDFGRAVLRRCSIVKLGQTICYGEIARQVGSPGAARAVGMVMARNRAPLVIPCHRVVKANGSLGGYSAPGGVGLKGRLLKHEAGFV